MEAHACMRVHFLPWSKSNKQNEIEWKAKHRTIFSDLLPLTYWYWNNSVREALTRRIALIEIRNKLFIAIVEMTSMTRSLNSPIFTFHLSISLVNLMFYTTFCWKWTASCHVFVKWPVGQKSLDHAVVNDSGCQNSKTCRCTLRSRNQFIMRQELAS